MKWVINMKMIYRLLSIIFLTGIIVCFLKSVFIKPAPGELHGAYEVLYVKDGDTFVVDIAREEITVRLIGVDAPESVHRDESKNTNEGKVASAWLKELLQDANVYLEYDKDRQDNYGRTLAYAYLEDGRMINALLLENGLATVMKIKPNTKYATEFNRLYKQAQKAGIGIWK